MSTLSQVTLALLNILEDIQTLHDIPDEDLYTALTNDKREEAFTTMYKALKEIKNG